VRLFAISDLHLGHEVNRRALQAFPAHPDDWLVLAGDVGERVEELELALRTLTPRYRQVVWVPGNHELWAIPGNPPGLAGEARYRQLIALCRSYGVTTPEDPYPVLTTADGPWVIAPLFVLYDYTFAPDDVSPARAVAWAAEDGVTCADEALLAPDPFPSRQAWCAARCAATESRLAALPPSVPVVLVNHFPLRRDLAHLPAIPRFVVWCGTRRTESWPERFGVRVVISGHLHVRGTAWRDGVRYEEVSLGYPRQWRPERGIEAYVRQVLPAVPPST
jgi:hypothetical protein